MTLARYLAGVALLLVALGPVVLGARELRRRLLPAWSGPPARLAEAIAALALVLVVGQLLGAVGLFSPAPVVIGLAVTGLAAWALARGGSAQPGPHPPAAEPVGRLEAAVAVGAVAVVLAAWGTRLAEALRHGMSSVDTLWYHLPVAARFVQEGSITGLHFVDGEPVTAFYPANANLLHAVGMLLFGHDVLSPLINLGWLALALLAGWCIGRRFGVAAASMVGVAVVLATPGMVTTQPGGAYNDVVGLALVLAAAALLLHDRGPRAGAFAAVAGGIALGTKFTMLAPVLGLALGVVAVAPRGARLRTAAVWAVGLAGLGGFWYARNLVAVGNPLPALGFGPLALPTPEVPTPTYTIAQYLTDRSVWEMEFLPGLLKSLGPAWWAIIALAGAGMAASVLAARDRLVRMLGALGLLAILAFLLTPQFLGLPGRPIFFTFNVRYSSAALALGLALLPALPMLAAARRPRWVLGALALVLLATQLDPSIWPTDLRASRFVEPVSSTDAILGLALGAAVLAAAAAWRLRARVRVGRLAGVAGAAAVVLAAGWGVSREYLDNRYRDTPPLRAVYAWAGGVQDSRIAIAGFFLQYPLYGEDLSNRVQFVGTRGPNGAFAPIADCRAWRRALNAGRYRYVITAPPGFPANRGADTGPEAAWTRGADGARELLRDGPAGAAAAVLFEIERPLSPAGCPAGAQGRRAVPGSSGTATGGG